MEDRSLQRSFSFTAHSEDISYKSPSQMNPPAPPSSYKYGDRGGYQVSPGTSYQPTEQPRGLSPSPPPRQAAAVTAYPTVPSLDSYTHYRSGRADLEALRQDYGRSPSPDYPELGIPSLNQALSNSNTSAQNDLTANPTPRKPLPAIPAAEIPSAQWTSYNAASPSPVYRAPQRAFDLEDAQGEQYPTAVTPGRMQYGAREDMSSPIFPGSVSRPHYPYADHRLSGPPASFSSGAGLMSGAAGPGGGAMVGRPSYESFGSGQSTNRLQHNYSNELGYQYPPSRTAAGLADLGNIDPAALAEDDDDGLEYEHSRSKHHYLASSMKGVAPTGFIKSIGPRDGSGQYGKLAVAAPGGDATPSAWLDEQNAGNKRLKWLVGGAIVLIIILAIVGGVIGAVVGAKKSNTTSVSSNSTHSNSSSSSPGSTVISDSGGDLSKDSPEIKALLNNPNLHQVFPGIDYTPINTQYPACLTSSPLQNNVTMDIAVLSQLTSRVRLYGNDCNQTEMVLHAIKALGLQTSMKVWLGVWQGNNATTNARQLSQLWNIIDANEASAFAGVIVGNEVLFRQDMTSSALVQVLDGVRTNLTLRNMSLPIATSDLGSEWTTSLASSVDIVMSNIHPFFAGVAVAEAAGWTWNFWQQNDVIVTQGMSGKKQIISEVGWPSGGGNDCGTDTSGVAIACGTSSAGSVAGIKQLNQFLQDWVCPSLANGTEYFWFEAFDEPWKVIYNTATQQWEDKWGLMDVNRNLKAGITIPNCSSK